MRRVVAVAALLGVLDGVVAVAVMRYLRAPVQDTGWFAYAPLNEGQIVVGPARLSWWPALLIIPGLLAVVTAAGAYVAWRLTRPGRRRAHPPVAVGGRQD